MNENNNPTPKLDADLVVTLTQLFALGYVDRMAGFQVTGNDLIDGCNACEIECKALEYIAEAAPMIHVHWYENPQMVATTVYEAGAAAYAEAERLYFQRN